MTEAFNGEFNITARPRLIALPPKSSLHNTLNIPQLEAVEQIKETNRSQNNSQLKVKPNGSISNSTPDTRSGTNTVNK